MPVYTTLYQTPGVYRRPRLTESRDVRLVRTDIAGFAGLAERGPLPPPPAPVEPFDAESVAIRLTSWKEYLATFGGFISDGYLPYAVRAFFENGGRTCYVVRVAAIPKPEEILQAARKALFALPSAAPRRKGEATTLALDAAAGETELTVADAKVSSQDKIEVEDLVEITSAGGVDFVMVIGRAGNAVRLARGLAHRHTAGTPLLKYSTALKIKARSEGDWGNRIKLTVSSLGEEQFALRVAVLPGPDRSQPDEEEFYRQLSLVKGRFFAPEQINGFSNLIRVEISKEIEVSSGLLFAGGPLGGDPLQLQGGSDGPSELSVKDFTGDPQDFRGLRLLEEIDEISILGVPDAVFAAPPSPPRPVLPPLDPCAPPPTSESSPPAQLFAARPAISDTDVQRIQRAMIEQCERLRDRVAILDFPANKKSAAALESWRDQFPTRFGAIYYPWLEVSDALGPDGATRPVPPCGHVAGIYARTDNDFGVQRPPANAQLEWTIRPVTEISSADQENLNPFGINAIRLFPGRGIRVWGARSLAVDDPAWRFIHVRRLMSMIEESVEDSMQWAVFEPNDFALRGTLVHSLSIFLENIWRTGGLKGARPADSFYVKCDETNNPPAVVDTGRIVCEIGIAVAAPMEFLVFEIRQDTGGAEIVEA
jgi:hypothetical protein